MEKKSFIIRNAELADVESLVRLLEQLFSIEKDFEFNPENHRRGLRLMLDGCLRHRALKALLSAMDQWAKKRGPSIFNSLQTRTMPLL